MATTSQNPCPVYFREAKSSSEDLKLIVDGALRSMPPRMVRSVLYLYALTAQFGLGLLLLSAHRARLHQERDVGPAQTAWPNLLGSYEDSDDFKK